MTGSYHSIDETLVCFFGILTILPRRVVESGTFMIENGALHHVRIDMSSNSRSTSDIDGTGDALSRLHRSAQHGAVGIALWMPELRPEDCFQYLTTQGVTGWLPTPFPPPIGLCKRRLTR